MTTSLPPGWTPARVYRAPSGLMVDWVHLGARRLTEPFFEQSVARALWNPAQALFRRQTPIEEVEALAAERPGLDPTAFVFHLSRCGSTLVSQMLASVARNIVVSEAPPLDRVLFAHLRDARVTRAERIGWLRGLVRALGRPRAGETRFFVKWDSWHVLELPLIREAFPAVPWVFLYRDPVEVMVSHARVRGMQMLPGAIDPRVFGPDWSSVPPLPLDAYCARVLARLSESALEHVRPGDGRLVNFRELPEALLGRLAPIFAPDATDAERQAMGQATRANAKEPSLPHVDDSAAKQREATAEIRRLVDALVAGPYARLEAARLGDHASHMRTRLL